MSDRPRILLACVIVAAVLAGVAACSSTTPSASASGTSASNPPSPHIAPTPTRTPTPTPTPTATPAAFDKHAESISDPASYWVVVNKLRPLKPKTYAPADIVQVPVAHVNPAQLRKAASAALVKMFAGGKAAGAGLMTVQSSYRSYPVQVSVYNGWVSRLGKKQADLQSARPGYSEHQTGLAVDISPLPLKCALAACMGSTPQGKWLAANAWKYGFLLRYPKDKTAVTGYIYEPWHFRYIGTALAKELHVEHVTTLEEFFGLPSAPGYAK